MDMDTAPEDMLDLRGRSITTFVVHELAAALEPVDVGAAIDALVDDGEAMDRDLDAWSAAVGHELRRGPTAGGAREYSVVKGTPRTDDRTMAMVLSDPGLFELLSPLGFALAASLEGIAVRLYFQAKAVRVLKAGFTPRINGAARPFSRFAARGLDRAGHVHPQEKLRQLQRRGAELYACGPSMEHFGVRRDQLVFPDVKVAAYLTFMAVMADADVHVFLQ